MEIKISEVQVEHKTRDNLKTKLILEETTFKNGYKKMSLTQNDIWFGSDAEINLKALVFYGNAATIENIIYSLDNLGWLYKGEEVVLKTKLIER